MGTNQPYENEPESDDDFLVKETVELDHNPGGDSYDSWNIDSDTHSRIKARAISRTGEHIRLVVVEEDEFEFFEEGTDYWYESQTSWGTSVNLEERFSTEGNHVLVVLAKNVEGNNGAEVTVEAWEF
ncbi:hypothetical protein [Salinarchaeum sp. Harcht-Bsk1]|uniref:hypothetical protein n=1 Tax=Salinarchaeum sp. Harcht-Bsk1 TaxID=1333523 RepID=UPI001181A060|nr:hypothetical protein [Salinarchaeum sp. Harcht-Bsk1]